MEKRGRNPALISLTVLAILVALLGIFASQITSEVSFLGGSATLSYAYQSGTESITAIAFNLPPDLAQAMVPDGASNGFAVASGANGLTLSGGNLAPGSTLTVQYHLSRYVNPGDRNFTTLATTSAGQMVVTHGIISVSQNVILEILTLVEEYAPQVAAAGILGAAGGVGLLLRDRQPDMLADEAETPPALTPTTQKSDDGKKPAPTTEERKKPKVYGLDLTQCPRDWVPEGTNTVTFTSQVYMCVPGTGWVPSDTPVRIIFKLEDVSSEPGICLNKGSSNTKDLWFPEKGNPNFEFFDGDGDSACEDKILGVENKPHKHFQKVMTKEAVTKATVVVRSEDFGSWGFIEATAEGCAEIPPRADSSAPVNCPGNACCVGSNKVGIPFDANNNHIADVAAQDSCGAGESGATTDSDANPRGEGTAGDGLTAYEEYRGFFVNEGEKNKEKHIRTDINKKDVFVYLDDKRLDRLGYFRRTDLEVHKITDKKLVNGEEKREINFNRHYATGGLQHALWLHNNSNLKMYGRACGLKLAQGWEDEEQPEIVVAGPPVTKSHICVNVERCTKKSDYMGKPQPADRLDQVVAHELGHGVNLLHHGEGGRHGHPHSGQQEDDYYFMTGTLSSGVQDCIMRYDRHGEGWCVGDADAPRSHVRHQTYWDTKKKAWLESPGTHYCESRTGDGDNAAGGATNDATAGSCKGQIKVKDWQ